MAIQGDISQINAHLIGLWLQLLATGAYFVYLPHCVAILVKKLRNGLSPWLPAACFFIFAATVLDFVVAIVRTYQGYAVTGTERPNPAAVYADPSSTLSLLKNAMNIVVAIISDAIIVYRAFIVWNMNYYVVLVPLGLLMGGTAVGIWAVWTLAQTGPGTIPILAAVSVRIRYFFIITFVLNILCSSMICYKIYSIQSKVSKEYNGERSATSRLLEIIIESAGFYCAHLLILIITNGVGTNYFFVFLDPLPPVGAYVFSMLIVSTKQNTENNGTTYASGTTIRFRGSRSTRPPLTIGVEIDLERVVDTDGRSPGQRTFSDATRDVYTTQDKDSIV
ncbi:uncharacterized protein TRAVEDRAFT_74190 [Trametes versicolor FP-101664 SS1]|uniref:uncharacterized protein n=1 Tax=Trametes versicolor (strain FP-101664) TaxID=717944 RepID=UPI00046236F8|nr:uncharacterized protein TRAVEDRAFT_74190 [Trametes versicolor FP-101664 SS1]EIW55361.1 hypothetical protein TRAVEDRAFT_74190 [Trametes versicolor FP-101664 SS1]